MNLGTFKTTMATSVIATSLILFTGCEATKAITKNPELSGLGAGVLGGAAAYGFGGDTKTVVITTVVAGVATYATLKYLEHRATEKQKTEAATKAAAVEAKYEASGTTPPKYVAIPTSPSPEAPSDTPETVLIWDTEANQVVGDKSYALDQKPAAGAPVTFDTVEAVYVGG